jgi:hypothetical protein
MDYMNYMSLSDNPDIQLKALAKSHYCAPYKPDNFIETIELDSYDGEVAKEKVKQSVQLLSYNNPYREHIVEIIDVLDNNKTVFLTDMHKYISFYWSGTPILLITVTNGVSKDKQLHISLQKYIIKKEELISDKKQSRLILAGLGGALLIGGFVVATALFKKYKD